MQKKSLIAEIENLVRKNNELYIEKTAVARKLEEAESSVRSLEERVTVLSEELAERGSVIAELEAKIEELSDMNNRHGRFEHDTDFNGDGAAFAVDGEDSVDILSNSPSDIGQPVNSNQSSSDSDYGAAVETASKAIGEVVRECSLLCADFAENGGSNAKDLVNLALGRTEVFKSEALAITEESDDIAYIMSQLGEKKKSTLDYFELLKKQI